MFQCLMFGPLGKSIAASEKETQTWQIMNICYILLVTVPLHGVSIGMKTANINGWKHKTFQFIC